MSEKDGGAAFPRPLSEATVEYDRVYCEQQDGMSLRDYFAAKAMQALIAKMPIFAWGSGDESATDIGHVENLITSGAYGYADAMLVAREAQP